MDNYWGFIIIFGILWVFQAFLTVQQQMHINKQIEELKSKYDFGYLGLGLAKAKYNLGSGVMVLLVADDDNIIHEFFLLQGVSVFSKFKPVDKYKTQKYNEVAFSEKETKLKRAFDLAVQQIETAKVNIHSFNEEKGGE